MRKMKKGMLRLGLIIGCIGAGLLSYVSPKCFGGEMSIVKAFSDYRNTLEYDDQGNIRLFSYTNYTLYKLVRGLGNYTIADIERTQKPYMLGYNVQEYKSSIVVEYGESPILTENLVITPYKTEVVNAPYGYTYTAYTTELDTANAVTKEIQWEVYPEECLKHCNGHQFIIQGTVEGFEDLQLKCTIYVLPASTLNQPHVGTGTNLELSNGVYTDGTSTGYFYDSTSGKRFIFTDGSYIQSAWQQLNGNWYHFDKNGYMEFNAYADGYHLNANGVRENDITYKWSKDGDEDIYIDSNGTCLKNAYALIDGKIHYFDLYGHLWQTFGYPSYTKVNENNVLVGYAGSFSQEKKEDIIAQVTKIRKEAVKLGLLKQEDYVVPKWSYIQERGAMIRAVEASIGGYKVAHDRLAENTVEVSFNGEDAGETCLAWGSGSSKGAIELYYAEKENALYNTGGVTGHYYALLYDNYIGTATIAGTNAYCIASTTTAGEEQVVFDEYSVQIFEMSKTSLKEKGLLVNGSVVGNTTIYTYNETEIKRALGIAFWEVDEEGNLRYVDEDGEYIYNCWRKIDGEFYYFDWFGNAQKYTSGIVARDDATGNYYKVTSLKTKGNKVIGGNVEFVKLYWKKTNKVTVPAKIKVNKKSFKVTSIASKAFQKNKYIKSVSIGANVMTIGEKAFYKCKNLKNITIKTKKLKKNSIGKNAFKGIKKSPIVKVPKNKKKVYKKYLKKAKMPSKATYKNY